MSDQEEMAKAYDPSQVEDRWYQYWNDRGCFEGERNPDKESYTIVIPPPNVTGILHLGHVLNNTLQDILIRYEKMRGKEICWVPGTDHAGIATQSKVEAVMKKEEGLTRHDLGREKFLERVWDWKDQYGGTIIKQLRTLGVGCDWRRERFTLDEGLSDAVIEVFIRLHKKGLIYRGQRIINWCPESHTALSDEEVNHKEVQGNLWYFKYPLADGSGHLTVATTRPETMLGDTGVAVNPNDERYKDMIGKKILLPIMNREIPIFGDEYVDSTFGTGAVKVTPAHDPNDYDMGQRHDLETINLMHEDASLNDNAGEYAGMDRYVARKAIVAKMDELGLLEKIEDHMHKVGYSERGNVPVESRLSDQWFVKMEPLAKPALEAVADGRIEFVPARWTKTYNHWLENIRDWCISRQLWWGHRIPAFYCEACDEVHVDRQAPDACSACGKTEFRQESDVLDTWFSSWLWPFSVFGWPESNEDLKYFYPTQSLVTGPDIIFFWVARMIMGGLEFMDEVPFKKVYFTSIIRDEEGRKLSKSLGNSPDPLEVIAEYGADAVRYTCIYIAPVGQDLRYSNKKCELGRNFANKLWNSARFRTMQGPIAKGWDDLSDLSAADLRPDDRWILAMADKTIAEASAHLEEFNFNLYSNDLYEFVWNQFCDWYVESAKSAFYSDDEKRKQTALRVYDAVMDKILRMMHPVMPFITEELFHHLGYATADETILETEWPTVMAEADRDRLGLSASFLQSIENRFELVRAGRLLRGTYKVPSNRRVPYFIRPTDPAFGELLAADPDSLKSLLNAESVTIDANYEADGNTPSAVGQGAHIYLPLTGLIDVEAEVKRLTKQADQLAGYLKGLDAKLSNQKFVENAKPEIVEGERARRIELREKYDQILEVLESTKASQ